MNENKSLVSKIANIYTQNLYELNIESSSEFSKIENIRFIQINDENYNVVEQIRDKKYKKEFKRQLSQGDIGIYALIDNEIVAYGWLKRKGSSDFFYIIDNIDYLCRFFVKDEFRGLGIYPLTIKELMNISNYRYKSRKFYISINPNNISSIKGATKLGAKFVNQNKFIRLMKVTLNKLKL